MHRLSRRPPARYDPTTLRSIEQMVRQKRDPDAIAHALGWPIEKLNAIAARHSIALGSALDRSETPTMPAKGGYVRRRRHVGAPDAFPRTELVALRLSCRGKAELEHMADIVGRSAGGIAGLVLDRIARSGRLAGMVRDAIAEMEQQR